MFAQFRRQSTRSGHTIINANAQTHLGKKAFTVLEVEKQTALLKMAICNSFFHLVYRPGGNPGLCKDIQPLRSFALIKDLLYFPDDLIPMFATTRIIGKSRVTGIFRHLQGCPEPRPDPVITQS